MDGRHILGSLAAEGRKNIRITLPDSLHLLVNLIQCEVTLTAQMIAICPDLSIKGSEAMNAKHRGHYSISLKMIFNSAFIRLLLCVFTIATTDRCNLTVQTQLLLIK